MRRKLASILVLLTGILIVLLSGIFALIGNVLGS